MPMTDPQQTFDRFERLAEAFIVQPSVVNGLELDEAAHHLKRVASQREDAMLTTLIHRFLRAIPRQEVATLAALRDDIRDRVAGQDKG